MCLVSCLCVPDRNVLPPPSALVLFGAFRFHPVNDLAVELFLNGDVRHGCGWRGPVPMFLNRLEPDHVPWSNVLDGTTPALDPATASRHDQRLAQRVAVPCFPSAGFNRDTHPDRTCRSGCLEQGSRRIVPVKYADGPFPEGCEPLLLMSICCIPPPCLPKQRGMFSVWW